MKCKRLLVSGCAFMGFTIAWQGLSAEPKTREFALEEVAPGVYAHEGSIEAMSSENLGDIANIGFIVGEKCVAVVDTGGSPDVGADLRIAVETHTDRPICYVINTHAHPDHVFGNSAFVTQDTHPTFIARENFTAALGARMQTYLERFSRIYGVQLTAEVIVPPDRMVSTATTIDLGNRVLKLIPLPTGHTNSDLMILDTHTKTLWTGDALFVRHIPVLDGSISGWLAAMDELAALDAARAVPGHGPVSVPWPQALGPQREYLNIVADGVRSVIDDGGTIQEAIDSVGRGARDNWLLFDEYHRRNVTAAFAELEWE